MGRHLPFFFAWRIFEMVAESEDTEDERFTIECPPVLTTERLVLRPPYEDDIADLAFLADNRHVAGMLARMPHPYGEAEARAFVAMSQNKQSGAAYALTKADNGAFIGCGGLNVTERGLELGYWIGEPFWKKGYATEAAHALVDLAFRVTGTNVLHASCRVINPASRRVIHKCGFQYAGQGMLNSIVAGQVPVERYRLDRKTWVSLRTWARS
jgi:RimJ/RimL family protein N-acetyltransferase